MKERIQMAIADKNFTMDIGVCFEMQKLFIASV